MSNTEPERSGSVTRDPVRIAHIILLLISAVLALCMWFYVDRVWVPAGEVHYSDLYPSWYGTRELLLRGRNPYGLEVSHEIQLWRYGHALSPGEQKNENRFAYPVYIAFLLAPTVHSSFPQVVRLFRWVLPIAALVSVVLWTYMLSWRCSRPLLGSLVLLSFGSFPVLESIYLQQPVVLAAGLLAAAGASLRARRLGLAGVLLALATIKPQIAALLILWLLGWAVTEWQSRKALVWGFGITMFVLVAVSEMLLPGWIPDFMAGIVAYQHYTGNSSLLSLLLGTIGGTLMNIAVAVSAAVLGWKVRRKSESSWEFAAVFCAILVVTVVIMPALYPTYQILLLPAIFLLLHEWKSLWACGRTIRLAVFASACLIAWPWLGASILLVASGFESSLQIRRFWIVPLSSLPMVPLSLLITFSIVALRLSKPPIGAQYPRLDGVHSSRVG